MPYVYAFEEGSKEQKFLLGGKGANLAEMTKLGLPVPPGFTITTDACNAYMAADDEIPDGLMDEVAAALAALEAKMGKRLGDADRPAARVGALRRPFSMPGMMDTVLNLGLNDVSVGGLAQADRQRALRLRLVPPLRADVRQDRARHRRREVRARARASCASERGVATDPELSADDLAGPGRAGSRRSCWRRRASSSRRTPRSSCGYAIEAVFRSWNGERARIYRRMEKIPDDLGTAVNVQTMVFGNKGDDSGTGVAFTRDPATGENRPYGDFLRERAGRGRRRRHPHHRAARRDGQRRSPSATQQLLERDADARRATTATCATSSSPSSRAGCSCCRRASASAPPRPRCGWPSRWRRRASSTSARRCCASQPAQLDQLLHPQFDPDGEVRRDHQGPQRVARRRRRQGLLHRRRRRGAPRRRRST